MSAVDEARLREVAPWTQANTDLLRVIATDVNIAEWFSNPTMPEFLLSACNALDALSAERERGDRAVGLLREALDWTQCNAACDGHFGMRCNCGGSDFDDRISAFLATQKAEGA